MLAWTVSREGCRMNDSKFDQIGIWSEVKLAIVREYASAYSAILTKQTGIRKHIYIDAFAGAGAHFSKRTREFVLGSPCNALLIDPPFSEYYFIDLDAQRASELRTLTEGSATVFVQEGDCNRILLDEVFPRCRYQDYHRALCLLDPYALNLDWEVLRAAGESRSIEVFYNFMIMDANRNVLWRDRSPVSSEQSSRMDRAWGDRSWEDVAYVRTPGLFGEIEEKAGNATIAEALRARLHEVAGFQYVPKPMPMRNSKGAVVYYLYFASPNKTGAKIVNDIFRKYRDRAG
jgi:three-Cys-motif partner protein